MQLPSLHKNIEMSSINITRLVYYNIEKVTLGTKPLFNKPSNASWKVRR